MQPQRDPRRTRAANHLLDYLEVRAGTLTALYESAYQDIIAELLIAAEQRGSHVRAYNVDNINLDEITQILDRAEKFLCAFNNHYANGIDDKIRRMIQFGVERSSCAYTLTDISDVFWDIFQVPPSTICAINQKLAEALNHGHILHVKDDCGTDLRIVLRREYDIIHIDGYQDAALDLTVNLPPGEVATYSDDVSGTIWFQGGLLGTIPIGRKHGLIIEPVGFKLVNNRISDVYCKDDGLRNDILYCLDFSAFTRNICEIGFGTHPAIRELLGLNYTYEEKHYGFHIGFGATLAQQNVQRETDHHLDLLFSDCTLSLDGRIIFDGEYQL